MDYETERLTMRRGESGAPRTWAADHPQDETGTSHVHGVLDEPGLEAGVELALEPTLQFP